MRYTYSYGYGASSINGVYLQASGYLTSLRQRVTAGSGTMIDEQATIGLYSVLITQGLISSLRRGYSDLAAVRLNDLGGGNFGVQERFDLNDGTMGGASSSVNAVQATAANQAAWSVDVDTGRRQTTYDGSNDLHTIDDLSIFNGQAAGTIFVITKDLNRTAGDQDHVPVFISRGDVATSSRAAIFTRQALGNFFRAGGRRLDSDGFQASSNGGSLDGIHALTGLYVWAGNTLELVVNGTAQTSTTFTSGGGLTQANNSLSFTLGAVNSTTNRLNGLVCEVLIFRTILNTTQITALRNFYRQYYPTLP